MPSSPSPPSALRIYLIEDSPVIRENLIATLEELAPVHVQGVAADEATAVRWLQQPGLLPHLVIVDLFLESGSGLGVLRAARALPHKHKLVVLTNYATPEMRRACLELGAKHVFDKSHDIDALLQYCRALADHPDGARAFAA